MRKTTAAANPDEYVNALSGWRRECVKGLRAAVLNAADFEEVVKWRHLVYIANGPAVLIRAEEQRVLFGFWRGQQLRSIEPGLRPGGKYEMASLEIHEGAILDASTATRLAVEAFSLNKQLGDPTKAQ